MGYCENCRKNINEDKKLKLQEQWGSAVNLLEEALSLVAELSDLDLADDQLPTLIANNQLTIENLEQALENCQTADKLLNRGLKGSDF